MLSKSRECSQAIEESLLPGMTATQENTRNYVFNLGQISNKGHTSFFCFFCSTSGEWSHDEGWGFPLCRVQHLFIHIFISGAFSPHFSGTSLQHKGNPTTLVGGCFSCTFYTLSELANFHICHAWGDSELLTGWIFAGVQSAAETVLPRQSRNHHAEVEASFWNLLAGNCNLLHYTDACLY